MRWLVIVSVLAATSPVLENPHVRAYRITDGSLTGVSRGPGVVVGVSLDGPA